MIEPGFGIPVVLVVAGHREHAIACAQISERLDVRAQLGEPSVDEVTRDHDEVGRERVDLAHHALGELAAEPRPMCTSVSWTSVYDR